MKITAAKLTKEAFSNYGDFILPKETDNKNGQRIAFYGDKLVGLFSMSNMASLSILALEKREYIINCTEKHANTEEIIGGYDTDVLFHVALSSNHLLRKEDFKAFRLPAGGYIRLKRMVWHYAPFPVDKGRFKGIVILPPFTYTHDCIITELDEAIEIEG